jgi:hypothetical protein
MIDLMLSHWATSLLVVWLLVIALGNLWPRTKINSPQRVTREEPHNSE